MQKLKKDNVKVKKEIKQNKKLQSVIRQHRSKWGFGDEDVLELLCYLIEEFGELSHCIRKEYIEKQKPVPEDDKSSLKHEIADVMIYLYTVADKFGIDVESAVLSKLKINDKRFIKQKER